MPIHHIEIIFTSSRDAPLRARSFLNELTFVFPNSIKINRGKQSLREIIEKAILLGSKYLAIVDVIKGNPGRMRVYDILSRTLKYKFIIKGVTLLSDLKLPKTPINKGCIKDVDHPLIRNFLIDFGYVFIDECDAYATGKYIHENELKIFELKFEKDDKILGPIIRFLII